MKPMEHARDWIQYVATAVAVVGVIWLHRVLENALPLAASYVFIACALAVFFAVVELAIRTCLNSSYTIRRFIMGAQHIEGWWVDVIVDPGSKLPVFGAVLRIDYDYETDEYLLSGQDFNHDGSARGAFTSTQAAYSRYVLTYRFDAHLLAEPKPSEGGVGILTFLRRGDSATISFSGFLYEPHRLANLYIQGERILDKTISAELDAARDQGPAIGRRIALDHMKRWHDRFKADRADDKSERKSVAVEVPMTESVP